MRIAVSRPLFAWDCLEDNPSLRTLRELLGSLPDARLLAALRAARGGGRNEYPVHVLWGVVLLQIALRHPTMEGVLEELARNEPLRLLIGIGSEAAAPKKWNMSRFLATLGREPFLSMVRDIFDVLVQRLAVAVKDLGGHTSADASHLSARTGRGRRRRGGRAGREGGPAGLPEPGDGRKEYSDEAGNVTSVVEWFGYKLHVLVDARHEVALAYQVSCPATGDNEELPELVREAQANLPPGRIETLAYDKAADTQEVHALLEVARIRPLIENRSLWKEEEERVIPGQQGCAKAVHDEAGTVFCYDTTSRPPVRHRMAYIGHEAARGTLKYRCPARHQRWPCPNDAACNAGRSYGRTVRVRREIDLRRFPAIPRATKTFERLYRGRTAVERVNGRLKVYWGADDGNITGAQRFHAYAGVVMIVHAAMATLLARAPRWQGTLGTTRLGPIARALGAKPER